MAEIAVFEFVMEGLPVDTAYTFGTPRVGNPAWAAAYTRAVIAERGVASFRVIHDKDPVPHLPPQVRVVLWCFSILCSGSRMHGPQHGLNLLDLHPTA
jgi:hypothetical protein